MSSARAEHSATLLANGEVLVTGGVDISGAPTKTSVIIGLGAVRSGPDLATARVGHSATLLANGQVLVAGGSSDSAGATVLDTSELFDPTTSTFGAGPALVQARTRHAAASYVRAAGEFVVFAGGSSGQTAATPPAAVLLDSVEVLDVTQGVSQATTAKLASAQSDSRIARLDTGSILIVGGQAAAGPAAAQIFNPATQTFSASTVIVAREGAAVTTRGREVLVAGGESSIGVEDTTEIYDSVTNTFAQGVRLGVKRADAAITAVGANDVVIVGGRDAAGASNAIEKLSGANFGQSTVTSVANLATARIRHTATGISGTKFVVVGGYDAQGIPLATVEQIDLTTAAPATTTPATTTPGTVTPGITPGTVTPGTTTPPVTTPPATTTPPSTGGLGGLLGGLFGGGSGSTSGGSGIGSTLLNAALNAAVTALTNNPGGGFSGFMSAFLQNFLPNAVTGLLGGSSTSGSTSGGIGGVLSSLLGSLTGGSTGSTGSTGSSSGIGSLLSSLLGSLTGGSTGSTGSTSSGGLGGLLSGLLGGGSSGSSGGGLGGLLSGLFGGGSTGGTTGGTTTPPAAPTAPAITSMTPGQGPVGTVVVITGTNFGTTVGVRFNNTVVPAASMTATRNAAGVVTVTMPVPAGATTGMVTVSTNSVVVNAGTFTVQ